MVISDIETGRFIDATEQWLRMLEYALRRDDRPHLSYEMNTGKSGQQNRFGDKTGERPAYGEELPIRFYHQVRKIKDTLWSAEKVILGGSEVMLSLIYDFNERKERKRLYEPRPKNSIKLVALTFLCIADGDGYFHRMNRNGRKCWVFARELEKMRFLDLVHPDDLEVTLGSSEPPCPARNRADLSPLLLLPRWLLPLDRMVSVPAGSHLRGCLVDITGTPQAEEAPAFSPSSPDNVVDQMD